MKNIKRTVATLGLLGIIILSNTSAQAGIMFSDRGTNPTTIERVFNSIRNVIIGQVTGVTMQSKDGIVVAGRGGIMFSD